MLIILYQIQYKIKSTMAPNSILKNSTCACLGLFFISLSALVMIQIFYEHQISTQIQNISVLKDVKYPTWGKNPNPSMSEYHQSFTLYSLEQIDEQIHAVKSNVSKTYQYHYEYQNTSFGQGNTGRLNFINKWSLKQVTDNAPTQQNIKTLNLAADKVYNYDYYAPEQRKFPILYNYILETLSGPFLEKFYAVYVHKFFFQYKQLVFDTVFKPLSIGTEKANQIYDHPTYGWANADNFQSWVKLSLKGQKYAVQTPEYQDFITQLQLSQKLISALVFDKSTLYNMISALNGTIQSKLMQAKNFSYKCEGYCSNRQLAAFQLANSFLTKDPLFSSLDLNMSTKDLNSTFLADIQYSTFCQRNKGKFDCLPQQNMAQFFTRHYLGDFELMNLLWKNQNNTDFIQDQFHLKNQTGKSVVAYVNYLYDEYVRKYDKVFSWVQTNYNNIQNSVNTYKNLFLVQLYSRAFFNKFIKEKEDVSCSDYFTGDFSQYVDAACKFQIGQSWNLIRYFPSLRKYIEAYFFLKDTRTKMHEDLVISYIDIIKFFRDGEKSLFAKQISEIDDIFRNSFGCFSEGSPSICSPEQLFCMQWGENKIFQNLPSQVFSNKVGSINEWDSFNILNGLNPDYQAIIGKNKDVKECLNILSSDTNQGIFSFFNMLQMAKFSQEDELKNRLKYIGKNVVQIGYRGLINKVDVNRLFSGCTSDLIERKKNLNISSGGAPWMQNQLKLIKTDNSLQIKNNQLQVLPQYDTINTGIYDSDKTRQLTKIWGESKSSSKYTVYKGKKTDDEGKQVSVDIFEKYVTDRIVAGTNLLGFHPYIESGQNLQAYVPQAHQPMNLVFDSNIDYEYPTQLSSPIAALKYNIVFISPDGKNQTFIGIEELNQNYLQLSPTSYAIIEPITGLTLEMKLVYNIKTNPSFTNYLLASDNEPINIYESQISYKRKGLSQIQQVNEDMNRRKMLTIVSIVGCSVSFAVGIALTLLYSKMRKNKDRIEESLLVNDDQNI